MYKYKALADLLDENGFNYAIMCDYLGISQMTWYHRLNGRRDWKTSEIRKISELLNLTPAQTSKYFLLNS